MCVCPDEADNKPEGKNHSEKRRRDSNIIMDLKERGGMWCTGFIWLRKRTSGGLFFTQ